MIIEWNQSLSVNIGEIDKQHQKLVAMLNGLNEAMKSGKGKDALGGLLSEMVEYAATHFATEERLMDQYSYPATLAHKTEHVKFVTKVGDFKTQFDKGTAMISIQIMTFLSDWLKNHIMKTDKQYGPFFNGKRRTLKKLAADGSENISKGIPICLSSGIRACSVDVAILDSQHKKLIAMINGLNDAMKSGKGKDALGGLLSELAA